MFVRIKKCVLDLIDWVKMIVMVIIGGILAILYLAFVGSLYLGPFFLLYFLWSFFT